MMLFLSSRFPAVAFRVCDGVPGRLDLRLAMYNERE